MKHFFLSLMLFISLFSIAQQPFNHDIEGKCSLFHRFKNSFNAPLRDKTHIADTYNPHYMHIKLEVNSDSTNIVGDVSTYAKVTSAQLDTIYLELNQAFSLDAVKLNEALITSYTFQNSELFVVLDTPLNQGDDFEINVCYHGVTVNPASTEYWAGVHNTYNSVYDKKATWSFSTPFFACDWLPMRQSLQYKIDSVYQEYTCPDDNMVGSNGVLEQVTTNNNGTKTFHWKTRYPIAYYLISFAVSDYMTYNVYAKPAQLQGDSILIQNFIYNHPNCLNAYQNAMDKSAGIMELYCEKYGLYPFYKEKYGNCLTGISGGMEHQTMTTISNFDFNLNAHEMSHQWFGNNITCGSWSDTWINEGFATYSEVIINEFLNSPSHALAVIKQKQNSVKSQNGGSVYVPEDEIYYGNEWRIFDSRLTYAKGACILHQLRYLVNDDDTFFGFLQHYTNTFRGKTATGAQFRDAMEDYTGLDLHPFFDQWYYGQGYPTYNVSCKQDSIGNASFVIAQTTSWPTTPFYDLPLEIKVTYQGGSDSTLRIPITSNITYFDTFLPKQVRSLIVDPKSWIIRGKGDISVGIDELQNDLDLVIGPNPAQDYIQVHFKATNIPMTIDIFDISGQLVQSHRLYQSGQHIDISQLPNAYYLVKATQGQATVSKKIVKI